MLQSLLQADDRLCRRHVDHKSHLHLYLHLHAAERYGRRYVDGLRVLPPVRLRLVRQRGRRKQSRLQLRLRMQPLLRIKTNFAGRETARQLLFLGGSGILSGIKEGSVCP